MNAGRRLGLVRPIGVLGSLQLNLKPLHADLEAVHRLDSGLRRCWVVERYETWKENTVFTPVLIFLFIL